MCELSMKGVDAKESLEEKNSNSEKIGKRSNATFNLLCKGLLSQSGRLTHF